MAACTHDHSVVLSSNDRTSARTSEAGNYPSATAGVVIRRIGAPGWPRAPAPPTVRVAPSLDPVHPIEEMVVIALPIRRPSETWTGNHYITQRSEEAVITAIVAAVLFVIALLLHLSGLSLGPLDVTFFELAGFVAVALHLAGVGASFRSRARR